MSKQNELFADEIEYIESLEDGLRKEIADECADLDNVDYGRMRALLNTVVEHQDRLEVLSKDLTTVRRKLPDIDNNQMRISCSVNDVEWDIGAIRRDIQVMKASYLCCGICLAAAIYFLFAMVV